jgi:hypothetical protein
MPARNPRAGNRGVMFNLATLRRILSPMPGNSVATGKLADKHDIHGFPFSGAADNNSFQLRRSATTRAAPSARNTQFRLTEMSSVEHFFWPSRPRRFARAANSG